MTKFTHEDAKRLIDKMRRNYGKKFADQWVGVTPDELAEEMVEQYQGLVATDFLRGVDRMKREEWPPTVPAFRSWCEPESKGWLGANEAWSTARGSIDFNGNELTVVWTKESATAFDSVVHLVRLGDKYQIADAKKAYVDMYDRLVAESLDRGEKPSYFISQGDDKEQHKVALREAESAGLLLSGSTDLLLESHQSPSDAKNEGKKFNSIAQEHIAKLRETLKIKNAPLVVIDDEKPIGFIQTENLPEWADPFDEPEKYKEGLKADGKAIPFALRNNF